MDIANLNEQPEKCAKCRSFPEDILMLACNHDLCLSCAAQVFHMGSAKFSRANQSSIICEICGVATQLDQSSVYELEKILICSSNQVSTSQSRLKKEREIESINFPTASRTKTPIKSFKEDYPTESSSTVMTSAKTNSRGYCIEHPEEEISYFCFDCLSSCICPECVIHGVHKNHEVQTIKRSFPIVKGKIDEAQNLLNCRIEDMKIHQEKYLVKKKELSDQNKLTKKQISDAFNELRAKIERKEKEILSNVDAILEENLRSVDSMISLMGSKISSWTGEIDQINRYTTSRDEALLLNFYSNNVKKLEKACAPDEGFLEKLKMKSLIKSSVDLPDIFQQLNAIGTELNSIDVNLNQQQQAVPEPSSLNVQGSKFSYFGRSKENIGSEEREDSRNSSLLQSKMGFQPGESKKMAAGHHLFKSDGGKIDLYKSDRSVSSISRSNGLKSTTGGNF